MPILDWDNVTPSHCWTVTVIPERLTLDWESQWHTTCWKEMLRWNALELLDTTEMGTHYTQTLDGCRHQRWTVADIGMPYYYCTDRH